MKITEIETIPVSPGPGYPYAVIVVLIRTDEGLTGIGEASLAGRGRGVLGIIDHARELLRVVERAALDALVEHGSDGDREQHRREQRQHDELPEQGQARRHAYRHRPIPPPD